jgi:hypothetical protein
MRGVSWLLAPAVLFLIAVRASAQPEEFRIDTDVFVGDAKEPFAENVTIFSAGLVYDFPLVGPREVTVFDPSRGRFVLLDLERQVKTTLSTQELLEFTAAMKVHAAEMGGLFAAAADPQFEQQSDDGTGWVTMRARLLTYRARGQQPEFPAAVTGYREFADWYSRLNATRPGSLPPFARIELNRLLAERGLVPEEVELTLAPVDRASSRPVVIRSRHLPYWRLSSSDRKRLEMAGTQMTKFPAVGFKEYRQAWQTGR